MWALSQYLSVEKVIHEYATKLTKVLHNWLDFLLTIKVNAMHYESEKENRRRYSMIYVLDTIIPFAVDLIFFV